MVVLFGFVYVKQIAVKTVSAPVCAVYSSISLSTSVSGAKFKVGKHCTSL